MVAGIYYIVCEPDGWRMFCTTRDIGHVDFWDEELAPQLANVWAPGLKCQRDELKRDLRHYPYAFPRGRLVSNQKSSVFFHGNDLEPYMRLKRHDIERTFRVVG